MAMSAGAAFQAAIARLLAAEPELVGVYDGPPARAPFPYASIDAGSESDWGHKSGEGREVLAAITVWDDQSARLARLANSVEAIAIGVTGCAGWQLVSMRLLRRTTVRDPAGPWATVIEFRARMLAEG